MNSSCHYSNACSSLGQAQLDQIDSGDYNELLKLLSVKQRVLGGLQDVESALLPFRDQDPNARAWPTMSERRECQMQAARCEEILQQLLTQEQVSETRMIHADMIMLMNCLHYIIN